MELKKTKSVGQQEDKPVLTPGELSEAKRIFRYFDAAFSAMKLYPPGNPSIRQAVDVFNRELKKFLDTHEELRIGIEEFSFLYKGVAVFQDEEKKKSLPFFLFKDGMRELSFYPELEREELQAFLEVLKKAIDLPHEESDVVSLLWEKDFVHIRYFVLDEYLDLSISGDKKIEVDPGELSEGKIVLTREDEEEIFREKAVLSFVSEKDEEAAAEGDGEIEGSPVTRSVQLPVIEKQDIPEIEAMLSKSRERGPLDELISLLFEILFFEEDLEQYENVLRIFDKYFQEILRKADFERATRILTQVKDLKILLSGKSEDRFKMLQKIEKNAGDKRSIEQLRKLFMDGKVENVDAFFNYLKFMGEEAVPVLGTIWVKSTDQDLRKKASEFLKDIGRRNISALLYFSKEGNVSLTKEIISLFETFMDEDKLQSLAEFASHPHSGVRLEVVNVLGKAENPAANKIILNFLSDEDDEVRIQAAQSLKYFDDREAYEYTLEMARDKDFISRTGPEKEALLCFLASTRKEEVNGLLRSILRKWSLFSASRQNETRLAAVSALQALGTSRAKEILEEGTKFFNKKIRRACQGALSAMK